MAEASERKKIVVIGAAGNLGRRLVARGLAHGHEVTAFVRNAGRFAEHWPGSLPEHVRVVEGDVFDKQAVASAVMGCDALVNAAGHVADGARFVSLFENAVAAAEQHMAPSGRIWLLAGAAVLTVPHTDRIGVSLPGVPAMYKAHETNWRRLQASSCDWSLMCPGPMVAAADGLPRDDLRISVEMLPYRVGSWARWAPPVALSLMMKSKLSELIVSYEDVAEIIMSNIVPNGRFSRHRVGVALPVNERGRKENWTLGEKGPTG